MKHFLVNILLIQILNLSALFAQDSYQPINFNNGRWVYTSSQKGPFWGSEYETDTLTYYFNGDTIINNSIYRKLFCSGKSASGNKFKIISEYSGAFRDDTVNKLVWFNGEIAYNYNLKVNDTVKVGIYSNFVVGNIDSVSYCGKYYKRFSFEKVDAGYSLIENIKILDILNFEYDGPTGYRHLCYYEINNPSCSACAILTGSKSLKNNKVTIYPNPSSDKVNIELEKDDGVISIYTSSGSKVEKDLKILGKKIIDVSKYRNGIYIIKISTDHDCYYRILIKE